jgi:hypothetical protein
VEPLEKIISNIRRLNTFIRYEWSGAAYSSIYVGEDVERSYVKLYDELAKHEDMFPKGVYKPW